MRALVIALLVATACAKSEHRAAREKFNEGVALLVKGDHEAAEKALLDARSGAGVDPELRFRAAYDLGMAYAAHAEALKTGKEPDLNKALDLMQQSVSWFADAARLRKNDKDTQTNLAIVRARAQSLSDELRKGEGKLEARLDALIGEQRSVLDDGRAAWVTIKQGGGADPLAQQGTLTHLADKERGIVAEAGVVGDLADSEVDEIAKKAEDKRTDQEKVRLVVLKNLGIYLGEARTKIAEARRKLQDLAAEDGVDRAEAALIALKRAREQLLDPITVLREVAQDELQLLQETGAVGDVESGKLTEQGKVGDKPVIPAWLSGPALASRQLGMHDRVEEVRARLAAAVEGPPPAPPQGANPDQQAEQQKLLERVKVALPFVTDASGAMDKAHGKLIDKKFPDAVTSERDALVALAKAIEQFADLKQTIDLASETEKQIVALLTEKKNAADTKEAVAANVARMPRIKELLADEVAKLDKQAQAPADPKADPKQLEAAGQQKQQLEAQKQQMATAESLRAEAEKLVGQLDGAIKANKDPLTPAKAADAKLDELRRLFFSVIEHLQDLIRQQGETRDQTSQAHSQTDDERAPKLPGIATREDQHGQLAKAITDALAAQADAAAKGQDPQQQQQGKAMSAAADEVRLAQNDMADAKRTLDKAISTTNQSVSLEPSLKAEASAI
ncbi:MAG TPA: hypothetical protein VLB44_11705, partial [Kofleriaceae bacterium]|nr:hypothetical protein [Kofleriaceae bacterium]